MRFVFTEILDHGEPVTSSSGGNREIAAAVLELTNPCARLSSTETRGKPFSCLGELCWYLAGSDNLDFIKYYVPRHYKSDNEGGTVAGAYGPRLKNWRGLSQLENITALLRKKPNTRQAVIQLFDATDLTKPSQPPCTCTLQFFVRDGSLSVVTYLRSNDAFLGLPHDIFCFTMIQEIIARSLGFDLGNYVHMVGSLHLYDKDVRKAKQFLKEGWQSALEMAPMPLGDPWSDVEKLLDTERQLRGKEKVDTQLFYSYDPYWADLHRLLVAFRCKRDKAFNQISELRGEMSSSLYWPFLDKIVMSG